MIKRKLLSSVAGAAACAWVMFAPKPAAGESYIVRDGQAQAEIVTAQNPPRTTCLAAQELQACIERISGAKLPIVTVPGRDLPVKIYVGVSDHTARLGIETADLAYGAYRMVSRVSAFAGGENWLALVGHDKDFTPIEPWGRSAVQWRTGEWMAQWDEITGAKWGNPMGGLHRRYLGRAAAFGRPVNPDDPISVWEHDEAGSFNAVCGFLGRLGARWYMPGELGEVLPALPTIPLSGLSETVRPDFPMRQFCFSYGVQPRDVGLWAMRLGVRHPYGFQTAHGLTTVTGRPEMLEAHPEYFALYGGKRNNDPESRYNHVCLSSEGLFQETVAYARVMFDHYQLDAVSVMPEDAYVAMCQCPLCKGKDTPERGQTGRLSDHVWDFVNRVAAETARTHPDRKITCLAYGTYRLPPLKIEKLHPNVVVGIVGGRRPTADLPEEIKENEELRRAWLEKTDNRIFIFENYPFTGRGYYLPSFTPRVNAAGINATKGDSLGEDIWLSIIAQFDAPGYNHFPVYFTARMYWGGPDQDINAMLEEYYRLFYGPAENEMRAFFEHCEANWREVRKDRDKFDRTFALLDAAVAKVDPASVYGRRIALVADYLEKLRQLGVEADPTTARADTPELRPAAVTGEIRIDGILDDVTWQSAPAHARGELKELAAGGPPDFSTTFTVAMDAENLYFAVRCADQPGDQLNIATTGNDDPAIWYGDVIELLLETDKLSYYQFAVNPAGAFADLDRIGRRQFFNWDSQAEVAAHAGDGFWTVEIRVPFVADTDDPLHQVNGSRPTKDSPWYFNLCRQRQRGNESQLSAFSPTGEGMFHVPEKFARLYAE